MGENSGSKIKDVATIFQIIGITVSVIWGLALMFTSVEGLLLSIPVIALGILGTWLGCLFLKAFGELVENSHKIVSILERVHGATPVNAPDAQSYAAVDFQKAVNFTEVNRLMQEKGMAYGEAMMEAARNQRFAPSDQLQTRICSNCGERHGAEDRFCDKCGTPL